MSDQDDLDLRAVLARIDRDRAETEKLQAETRKFVAEHVKLFAQARKLERDRWLAPALAIAAVVGGLSGAAAFIARLIG